LSSEIFEDKKEKILMKNNILVKAKYSLTTNESRVFLLMLFKLQKTPEGVLSCSIEHDEIAQFFKSKRDKTVDNIKVILSSLRKKPIHFWVKKVNGKGSEWGEYGFINGFTYNIEKKTFTIEASEKIYSLMKSYLEDGYTPNNLAVLMGLRNPYSYRLYDLLRAWSGSKNIINYQIDSLREYLMLEDSYPKYADFKKRALNPAVDELNKTGFFEIETKEQRDGKKVVSVDFIVKDKDKRKYFDNPKSIEQLSMLPENEESSKENEGEENAASQAEAETKSFYIPNYIEITSAMLKRFEKDYGNLNFNNKYYEETLEESYYMTLEKDQSDIINYKNYKLFKEIFEKKLDTIKTQAKAEEIDMAVSGRGNSEVACDDVIDEK